MGLSRTLAGIIVERNAQEKEEQLRELFVSIIDEKFYI